MSSAAKLTPNGYTDAEETYALRLYDTDLGGPPNTSGATKLNSQSMFLRHALTSAPTPGNLPQRVMDLYLDKKGYDLSAEEGLTGDNPFREYNTNLRSLLLHSRHYGRIVMPRKVSTSSTTAGAFAETGALTLSIAMDWLEASLYEGYRPRAETRVLCKRREPESNIIDLLFESALTGLPGTDSGASAVPASVLQLREVVPANLFNVRTFDAQNKLIRPIPSAIQVHTSPEFGATMLFEIDFTKGGKEFGESFATTEARVSWAAMFATRVLGYLSIIRVLNAGMLSCVSWAVVSTGDDYTKTVAAAWSLFSEIAKKVSDEIKPPPPATPPVLGGAPKQPIFHLVEHLRADDDAKSQFPTNGLNVVTAQLGAVLLRDMMTTYDLSFNAPDPARRIRERRAVMRRVDEHQAAILVEWRKKIATNLGMGGAASTATPSTIVEYALRTFSPAELYTDIYNYPNHKLDNLIWPATKTATEYPSELSAPASPDDERMLRVLQERSEAALRVTFRYLGETIAVTYGNCVIEVAEAAPVVDLLRNLRVGDDDLGRASFLYIIGVLSTSRAPGMPASIALPGGETLATTIKRLADCIDKAGILAQSVKDKANTAVPPPVPTVAVGDIKRLIQLIDVAVLPNQITPTDAALADNFINAAGFFKDAIARLKRLVEMIDSNTLWRSGLQKLPPLASYYAKDIVEHVPATLEQLQTATLAQAGLARELSNRLRLFVEDAARLVTALQTKETEQLRDINYLLELLEPLTGPDESPMDEDKASRKRRYDNADLPSIPADVRAAAEAEVAEEDAHATFARQLKQYAKEAEVAQNAAYYEAAAQTRAYKRAQLEAERDIWTRRQQPTEMVSKAVNYVRALESVTVKTDRSISREDNTLVLLHLESALQMVRGGRLTVPGAVAGAGGMVAAPVIGGDEARRFFSTVVTALENARLLSESLELYYVEGRKALEKIRALDAQLRPEEEALLIEQMELNRQVENDVIASHVDTSLRLALFVANLEPAFPALAQRISATRIALVQQKASLDSTTLVGYASRLLASLRDAAKSRALEESRFEQNLTGQVAAITHLGIAGYLMQGELALARWEKRTDAQLEQLEAPLRAAEELVARHTLASLLTNIRNGRFIPLSAAQLFGEYRALLESISGTTKIDYVPIPTTEVLNQFSTGGTAESTTTIIVNNLKRYDALQREYFSEVVVREPRSKTYEESAFIGKQQLSIEARADVHTRMLQVARGLDDEDARLISSLQGAAFLIGAGGTWYTKDTLGKVLDESHSRLRALLQKITEIAGKSEEAMQEDNPSQPILAAVQRNSAEIYRDLRFVVITVDSMFTLAIQHLKMNVQPRKPVVDDLFTTLRVVQEEAVALLKQYFATDIQLPPTASRELPWKVVDLDVLGREFDAFLRDITQ